MSDELSESPDLDARSVRPRPGRTALRLEILRLTWPVVLQNLFRTFMIVVDTALVGHLGTDALASMSVIGSAVTTTQSTARPASTTAASTRRLNVSELAKNRGASQRNSTRPGIRGASG